MSKEMLQDVHSGLCKKALDILQKDDPTVQELEFVRKFLHDNRIEAKPAQGSPMGAVRDAAILRLPEFASGQLMDEDDPAAEQLIG